MGGGLGGGLVELEECEFGESLGGVFVDGDGHGVWWSERELKGGSEFGGSVGEKKLWEDGTCFFCLAVASVLCVGGIGGGSELCAGYGGGSCVLGCDGGFGRGGWGV